MPTPLYPVLKQRIDDAVRVFLQNQVTPWAFFRTDKTLTIRTFFGKEITYSGMQFEDTPRDVFWAQVDPFLQDMIGKEITAAVAMAKEREVDARLVLPEVQELLFSACKMIYERMLSIDQRLNSQSNPRGGDITIGGLFVRFEEIIGERIKGELALLKPQSKLRKWYTGNQHIVFIVGTVLTVVGLVLKAFGLF
ncbi:hypothetical protein [Polaromonas sp. YR568]|uniref:hypothetical protein n=1 Tax=Polaromonas sp. YR568 TaxID=1855301 RepID=UPI0031380283